MFLHVDIPTPKACVDCRFHTVDTDGRYGKWIMRCLVKQDVKMEVKDGLKTRNPLCPGIIKEEKTEE